MAEETEFLHIDREEAWQAALDAGGRRPERRERARYRPDRGPREAVEFETIYPSDSAKAPQANVKLDARLTLELGQAVVASQTFAASRKAASADLPDVVDAYNQALAAVLSDLIPWTLKTPPRTS
jgi:hypothetical protein